MKKRLSILLGIISAIPFFLPAQEPVHPLLVTKAYTVYRDSLVQEGKYRARIISPTEIISDYKSPANQFKDPKISFKFSINGKDNEMPSGKDHQFVCLEKNGACETPVIEFGRQFIDPTPTGNNLYLAPAARLKIKVDMNAVFKSFDAQGYYTCFNGDKIYKQDFKGVYIAGNTSPLIWDFDNLINHPQLQMTDPDGDHIYEAELVLNKQEDLKTTDDHWQLKNNIDSFPAFQSGYPISDALYNLSIEEMTRAIEPDSTFRTGKEWAGVWTRDISYSIILSMACLQPEVAKKSLMRKVNKKGRIIQDTGTGGAYPCSTDRMIWATAAWEIYQVTGDLDWLKQVFPIIQHSIEDDRHIAYDPVTGLVKGESSFLDWREQTYPKWMQPADIFESECLGTNAVHYHANIVLAEMATVLHHPDIASNHRKLAARISKGINQYLWIPAKGYYGQFLYGRIHKTISTRSEALGEALCVLWGIADSTRRQEVLSRVPVTDFGILCIYPEIPGIPPYHNNAVWPFVQTYWLWAAGKNGNETAVVKSIGDIYRPAALFLTNKENFVAENGDFSGTQINSSNMLWSLSGNISIVYRIFFGIRFENDGLSFEPFVPRSFPGSKQLRHFRYRNALLNISIEGFGNGIKSITMDGHPLTGARVPTTARGEHSIHIVLNNRQNKTSPINTQPVYFSLTTPAVVDKGVTLEWQPVERAVGYQILKNGISLSTTTRTAYSITRAIPAEYQVIAIDKNKVPSFASEPVLIVGKDFAWNYEAESFAPASNLGYQGYTGQGFVELSASINRQLVMPVTIATAGWYSIDFRYANGNGPTNTQNKCAIRTVLVDQQQKGTVVFPQRGINEWSNWGYSNPVSVYLSAGHHDIALSFEEFDDNMNGEINQAMVDNMRMVRWPN